MPTTIPKNISPPCSSIHLPLLIKQILEIENQVSIFFMENNMEKISKLRGQTQPSSQFRFRIKFLVPLSKFD